MNILFATGQPFTPQMFGGLQTSANELALALRKRGHDVSLLCALTNAGVVGIKGRLTLKFLGQKAACDTLMGYPVWRSWFPWECLEWVAEKVKPDIIIVLARQPVRMALAVRRARIPVLMMLQDVEFSDHGGIFSSLGNVPCVANSRFTAERYQEAFGVTPRVIHPLVDPAKYRTDTTMENITFINPHRLKGVERALAIAAQCPEIPFSFVETWPLKPGERAMLQKALSALPNGKLRPGVRDMRRIYGQCRILLAPSLWQEAYGRVASEAQLSGIPVVASNRGGLPEAVGPGGVLLNPEAPLEHWVAALRRLWNDRIHYEKLSAAAQAHSRRPELQYDQQLGMWEAAIASALTTQYQLS